MSKGAKKKLIIVKVDKEDNEITGRTFKVMLNPEGYSRKWDIVYNDEQAIGETGKDKKFSKMGTAKLTLKKIVLDGTGVVAPTGPGVDQRIENLKKTVYSYDGKSHEPSRVKVSWGSLMFYGRLTSLSIDYTLFKPDGTPLRAEVAMEFENSICPTTAKLKANSSSPDLTHLVEVGAGDTLPLLCQRIYGDVAYYPDVAKINNLPGLIRLQPGTTLRFPPLV